MAIFTISFILCYLRINSSVKVVEHQEALQAKNALDIVEKYPQVRNTLEFKQTLLFDMIMLFPMQIHFSSFSKTEMIKDMI